MKPVQWCRLPARAAPSTPRGVKLLVTGGCGFIGSAVVRQAIRAGHHVVNVDCLTYAANPANVASVAEHPVYGFEKVDIRNAAAIRDVFDRHHPDTVVHLAAESHVDRSIDGPDDFIQTNIVGTFNLLEAARHMSEKRQDVRFVHVSTDEVYGDLGPDDPAFSESTPYAPSSPYSASKAASDHLARAWHRTYGLPVIVTNCSNNYGPYQYPEKLIPVVILKALAGERIPVYGTGENVRDWLHVEDHARALLRVADAGEPGRTYNIGGDNERTNIDLVRTLCDLMDELSPTGRQDHRDLITYVADRPGHDRRYAIDASRIRDELGWEPSVTGDEGFADTVRWYLDNEAWWRPLVEAGRFGSRIGTSKGTAKGAA